MQIYVGPSLEQQNWDVAWAVVIHVSTPGFVDPLVTDSKVPTHESTTSVQIKKRGMCFYKNNNKKKNIV